MNDNNVYTGLNADIPEPTPVEEIEKQKETETSDVIRMAKKQLLELLNSEKNTVLLISDLPEPQDLPNNLSPTDAEVMARKRYINLLDTLIYRLDGKDD